METHYKTDALRIELESEEIVSQKYNPQIFSKIEKFRKAVYFSTSFHQLKSMNRSLHIHGKKNSPDIYIAYLNTTWRLEFNYSKDIANIITVYKVHPHKYKK